MSGKVLKMVLTASICAVILFTAVFSCLNADDDGRSLPYADVEMTPSAPVDPDGAAKPDDGNSVTPPDKDENNGKEEGAPPSADGTDTEMPENSENGGVQTPPESPLPDTEQPDTESKPSISLPAPPAQDENKDDYRDYISRLVSIANGELGTKEKKYNNVKYNTWYYGRPVSTTSSESSTYAWCITFISWCASNADIPTEVIPKMNSSSRLCAFYKEAGLFETRKEHTPAVGDIIFFGKKSANHAGIVVAVTDTTVTVIEGNSSDKVNKLTYSLSNSSILGYATPDYAGI